MKAIRYEKDAVLIQDRKVKAWVDIRIENNDVICDWNQNDFDMANAKDITLKRWQDKLGNFEDATSLAIITLENSGIIYQDENGKWHQTSKYHLTKGSISIK